ncbi:tail fiber assembly protein [Escherichia coli]|uniref:tail fiber assembly protein n=1 Tax=Escherichia coli TaxID=562 RepID=UPI001C709AB0|nr:tail fiber assembly protein [Escherichia coli]MBW9528665.1 tail fiber assembly protein [Escherichia coli]MBW9546780.1 tail fiber assembly protein [Escherichia coli]MBW9551346.1 tail fiber assembly protein [Escherichia coli]MBW9556229.1 tail fiber assembly protein [Escherichia coli]MBW9569320.1 tail fiber assembly protein [Escherichia coli]
MKTRYFYDAVDNGFYIEPESRFIPESAIEISVNLYNQFAGIAWPEGKMLGADSTGLPAWVDAPPPKHEEQIAAAEQYRQQRLQQIDEVTADWRVELMLGDISDEDKAKLSEWMAHKKAVKAVDTSTAPDVIWPEQPEA